MARYNTFVATLSVFESLILKQIDLCSKTVITHFIIIVPLKCGILQGPHPQQIYRQHIKTRRNVCTQAELWRWNKPRSRRWCSPLEVAWHPNVKSITSD